MTIISTLLEQNRRAPARRFSLVLLTCFAIAAGSAVTAQAAPRALLVVDSSRSMWGHIDGINKVVIARKALSALFKRYDGKIALGLMAYGHQKSADCTDFAELAPVGPLDARALDKALASASPKGSTPITATLKDAAARLAASGDDPTHIVLLSDGLDNCRGDPCGFARSLKQSQPQITLDVIAFDRKNAEALKELACIAEPSGGIFASAQSAADLNNALAQIFAQIVNPRQQRKVALAVLSDADPTQPVDVRLAAYLGKTGQIVDQGVVWRIFAGRAGDDGRYKLVVERREAQPDLKLSPGVYLVNVSLGRAYAVKRLEIQPGQPAREQITVNAGGLRLQAVSGQAVIPEKMVSFDIYSNETDQSGNRYKLIADAKPGVIYRLNSGDYLVTSSYGRTNATISAEVKVAPGKLSDAVFKHHAARITFRLVRHRGGEALAGTRWRILEGGGAPLKQTAGAFPSMILAAGAYRVRAEHGEYVYQRDFTVTSGQDSIVEVLMK